MGILDVIAPPGASIVTAGGGASLGLLTSLSVDRARPLNDGYAGLALTSCFWFNDTVALIRFSSASAPAPVSTGAWKDPAGKFLRLVEGEVAFNPAVASEGSAVVGLVGLKDGVRGELLKGAWLFLFDCAPEDDSWCAALAMVFCSMLRQARSAVSS